MNGAMSGRTGWARKATSLLMLVGMLIAPPGLPVALAAPSGERVVRGQVDFQQGSGRVNPELAKEYGKQLGADVVLYGTLRSIQKKKGRSLESVGAKYEDVYYQFVLNCVDIETGEIIWANEEELTKRERIGLFGS